MDRHHHPVDFDLIDLHIPRCPVMDGYQIFQAFFYRLRVHGPPAGKLYALTKRDLHGTVICKFIAFCQPGFHFHIVIVFEKRLTHSIA